MFLLEIQINLNNSEIIILPGVGTFPQAMKQMKKKLIIKKLKIASFFRKKYSGNLFRHAVIYRIFYLK